MSEWRLVCPKSPDHKEFSVMAHVTEEWRVDEQAHFLESLGVGEVVHEPAPDDCYTCMKCGAEAKGETS